MKKDIIYIDTEDDITSIIEKVKAATEKIIALVPPKRVGVLQSAVNLKLLQKAATNSGKRLVIITHSVPLASLAAGVQIPVAKTLQSRPEIAATEMPVDDDDDIIRGDELPVGDHHKSAQAASQVENDEEVILPEDLDIVDDPSPAKKVKKSGSGIPNFDDFRKKIIFIGGGIVLLIIFLIWANVFAPRATVNIQAKTDAHAVDLPIALKIDGSGNPKNDTLTAQSQQIKKTASAEFIATGKKEIGNKATGTMTVTRASLAPNKEILVPAGTGFSSGNFTFVSTEDAMLGKPYSCGGDTAEQCSATIRVQAAAVGEDYNLSSRAYQATVSGLTASGSAMTGGLKQQVTIISDADVEQAKQKLVVGDQSAIRNELAAKFNDKTIVIKESFTSSQGAPAVAPAVGEQAAKAQITVETTYTLLAIDKSNLDVLLDREAKEHIKSQDNQRVYDNGRGAVHFTKYNPADLSLHLTTTSYTGPRIDVQSLKSQLVGKNYEEVRQIIQTIDGVKDVDTKFSPFWVSKIPGDEKKTDIVFKVSRDGSSN